MPLLIAALVVVGAIFLLRWIFQPGTQPTPNNQPVASFFLSSGKARVLLPSGTSYSVEADPTPTSLNVGEGLESIGDTRIEVTLQDGSIVRLDGNSALKLDTYQTSNNKKQIALSLDRGAAWVKTAGSSLDFLTVKGKNSQITAKQSAVFAINRESDTDTYRGIQNTVEVRVFDQTADKTVGEVYNLGLGQQIEVTGETVAALKSGNTMQLLNLLDESFRSSAWYKYNTARDNNDTPVNGSTTNNSSVEENQNESTNPGGDESVIETTSDGPTVKVTSFTAGDTVTTSPITLRGTVSKDAVKVVVDDYILQKYVPGSGTWYYIASATSGGNLFKGKNIFKMYAIDGNGKKGPVLEFPLTYNPNANTSTATTSSTGSLKAPGISTNSGKSYATSEAKIDLKGTIDSSVQKVFVNGYQLQKYTPGSGTWLYYAYEEYGTLKAGNNTFSVYGVDAGGKKTPTASITITYTKSSTGSGTTTP